MDVMRCTVECARVGDHTDDELCAAVVGGLEVARQRHRREPVGVVIGIRVGRARTRVRGDVAGPVVDELPCRCRADGDRDHAVRRAQIGQRLGRGRPARRRQRVIGPVANRIVGEGLGGPFTNAGTYVMAGMRQIYVCDPSMGFIEVNQKARRRRYSSPKETAPTR